MAVKMEIVCLSMQTFCPMREIPSEKGYKKSIHLPVFLAILFLCTRRQRRAHVSHTIYSSTIQGLFGRGQA